MQVVDNITFEGVRVSIHTDDGWEGIDLTEAEWEKFKASGDDAMAMALGRKPPRGPDDPEYFRGVPTSGRGPGGVAQPD